MTSDATRDPGSASSRLPLRTLRPQRFGWLFHAFSSAETEEVHAPSSRGRIPLWAGLTSLPLPRGLRAPEGGACLDLLTPALSLYGAETAGLLGAQHWSHCPAPGTWYLVPSTWCPEPSAQYLVPNTHCLVPGT